MESTFHKCISKSLWVPKLPLCGYLGSKRAHAKHAWEFCKVDSVRTTHFLYGFSSWTPSIVCVQLPRSLQSKLHDPALHQYYTRSWRRCLLCCSPSSGNWGRKSYSRTSSNIIIDTRKIYYSRSYWRIHFVYGYILDPPFHLWKLWPLMHNSMVSWLKLGQVL